MYGLMALLNEFLHYSIKLKQIKRLLQMKKQNMYNQFFLIASIF